MVEHPPYVVLRPACSLLTYDIAHALLAVMCLATGPRGGACGILHAFFQPLTSIDGSLARLPNLSVSIRCGFPGRRSSIFSPFRFGRRRHAAAYGVDLTFNRELGCFAGLVRYVSSDALHLLNDSSETHALGSARCFGADFVALPVVLLIFSAAKGFAPVASSFR